MPRNIRLLLEYDGSRYHGWQRQVNALSIQEVLEAAVARLTGAPAAVIASGRTDAGVHALGQVANFRTEVSIPLKAFHLGLNALLPKDIAVLEAAEVPWDFHARKSARAKTYEYRILNRPSPSPLRRRYAWW
ncbi:MAG: tRNA pseudouridine(38-40) synthase TruA, partial [Desulfobaccales bacterium]